MDHSSNPYHRTRLFLDKAHPSVTNWYQQHPDHIGRLVTPRNYGRTHATDQLMPWAIDNDAYSGFNPKQFIRMLHTITHTNNLKFITAPDTVGDHTRTLKQFKTWGPRIRPIGPVAFVAQNGATTQTIPWDDIDALFIGGTTQFKLNPATLYLIATANERGLWTHMGRVNTLRRATLATSWNVNSIDGSSYSRFSHTHIPRLMQHLTTTGQQLSLGGG